MPLQSGENVGASLSGLESLWIGILRHACLKSGVDISFAKTCFVDSRIIRLAWHHSTMFRAEQL